MWPRPGQSLLVLEVREDGGELAETPPASPRAELREAEENGAEGRQSWQAGAPYTAWLFWAGVSTVESVKDLDSLSVDSSVSTFRSLVGRDLRNRAWKPWAATT